MHMIYNRLEWDRWRCSNVWNTLVVVAEVVAVVDCTRHKKKKISVVAGTLAC